MQSTVMNKSQNIIVEQIVIPEHPGFTFVNPELHEEIRCVICLDPCTSALVTICGHYFCTGCFIKINKKDCPTCRKELKSEDIRQLNRTEDRPIRNIMAKVQVKC